MKETKTIFKVLLCALLLACPLMASASQDDDVTKKITVSELFHGITASSGVDVVYTQTTSETNIELVAPSDKVDRIWVRVKDGNLTVSFENKLGKLGINKSHKAVLRVSAPDVFIFNASGSSAIVAKYGLKTTKDVSVMVSSSGEFKCSTLQCNDLTINGSSAGDVEIDKLACTALNVDVSSSADFTVENITAAQIVAESSSASEVELKAGTCQKTNFKVTSAAEIEAAGVKAAQCIATVSSAGKIECYASEKLTASCSSAGAIYYAGNPKDIITTAKRGLKKMD